MNENVERLQGKYVVLESREPKKRNETTRRKKKSVDSSKEKSTKRSISAVINYRL